jgi:hypothetical protein
MRRVRVEESAAIGTQNLDGLLRCHRPHGQRLSVGRGGLGQRIALGVLERHAGGVELGVVVLECLDRRHILVGVEVLNDALTHEEHRERAAQRQQQVQGNARQVHPEIADSLCGTARKTANQRKRNRNAGGRREKILHGERRHLREVAHRGLARVRLPIGVGDETHRGIECRVG